MLKVLQAEGIGLGILWLVIYQDINLSGQIPPAWPNFCLNHFGIQIELIKHAAIGDPVAAYVLAEIFISDEVQTLLRPDMQMAEEYYNLSAASNYAPACVQIALIKIHSLSDSLSVDTNKYSNGLALLQKGIDQDLPAAHHYLGRCFIEGKALSEDKALALVHFQAAAERMFGPH